MLIERINGVARQVMPEGTTRAIEDTTDWARLQAMTNAEIEADALADEDSPPLTPAELSRLRPVPNPKDIRKRLNITQQQFAAEFELPLGTLRA